MKKFLSKSTPESLVQIEGPPWIVEATDAVFRVPGGLLSRFALELENTGSNPQRDSAYRRVSSRCSLADPPSFRGAGPCRVTGSHDATSRRDRPRMITPPEMARPCRLVYNGAESDLPLRQARGGVGDGAPVTPPFWLCAPTKVGASGGWNHRRGPQRRSRRPLPGRVECPPCASLYSPGAAQSSVANMLGSVSLDVKIGP